MMHTPFTLRDIPSGDDIAAVGRLVAATGFFHPREVQVAVELIQERLTRGAASGYEFVFAEADDQVAGFACYGPIGCTEASYDLYWIVVDPARQGSGIGTALLSACEQRIAAAGGRRIYVETSSRALYAPTRGFYLRCGYVEEARLADFYSEGDGKVIYVKTLH